MPTPAQLWKLIQARKTVVPSFAEIPSDRVINVRAAVDPIFPGKHYIAVVIDELFLANGRQWYREFDPMVLAVTELVHGIREVTLPFVVGPKLLGENATNLPQGMLYKQTRVAGVHPYRGGRVVSTVVLWQVRRVDYARQLLKLVESVATAVPFAADLGTYTRYADSLLDGVDALFSVGGTTPLVGIRQEFDHDLGTPFRSAYFALVDAPEDSVPSRNLWVREGVLMVGERADSLRPLRDASYVLFSTRGASELSDLNTLPVYAMSEAVINLAASSDDADWKRAKAELVVLLRQLLASPDLTREQALRYHETIVLQAQEAHQRARNIGTLAAEVQAAVQDDKLRDSVALLDLP